MVNSACWSLPPHEADIAEGTVHIWRVNLDQPQEVVQAMEELLPDEERERAKRFTYERDARRYKVSHGALRSILSGYLGIKTSEIRFQFGKQGKPALEGEQGVVRLQFNLAHSHEHALVAVTRSGEIGVDIEYLRPIDYLPRLAEQVLTDKEQKVLRRLTSAQQQNFFFRCWTRKEAIIKANGAGLAQSLDLVEVTFIEKETVILPRLGETEDGYEEWRLNQLNSGMGYVGAVAIRNKPFKVDYRQWSKSNIFARDLEGISAADSQRTVKGFGVE